MADKCVEGKSKKVFVHFFAKFLPYLMNFHCVEWAEVAVELWKITKYEKKMNKGLVQPIFGLIPGTLSATNPYLTQCSKIFWKTQLWSCAVLPQMQKINSNLQSTTSYFIPYTHKKSIKKSLELRRDSNHRSSASGPWLLPLDHRGFDNNKAKELVIIT